MAYLRPDSAGKSKPKSKVKVVRPTVGRPAPAKRNESVSQKPDLAKSKGERYHGPNNPLVKQFDAKFKAARGHSLRQYANMPKALLDAGIATPAEIRSVLNPRNAGPDKRNPDPRLQAEALKLRIAEKQQSKKKDDGGFLGLRFDVGDAVDSWKSLITPTGEGGRGGGVSGVIGAGRDPATLSQHDKNELWAASVAHNQYLHDHPEKGLEADPFAEAILGGFVGGAGALGAKAILGQATKNAAGGLLTGDALKEAPAALRFTTPTKGIARHVIANRPSVARPLADFAGRGPLQRIGAGSAILASSGAANKVSEKSAKVADKIRGGAAKIEVDPSELSLDAQAVAAGKEPPKPKNLAGLKNGPGRLGLTPSLRRRLLHQARVNGWPVPDSVNDTELVAKAYKVNRSVSQRLAAGLVENAGNAAFVPAFAGAAYDAATRTGDEGAKPWTQIAEGMANAIANAAKNPIDNPVFAFSIYNSLIKGVGAGSAKALRVKEQPLSFKHGEINGAPYVHQYGVAKPNTLTRPAALLGQKILNTEKASGARKYIMAKQAGRAGETITTRARATGTIATRDLSKALSKLGKKEQILAVWSNVTGSSAKNQHAYYQRLYESSLRRKTGYTNSKGKEVPPRKVDEVNLRALKAKAKEWEQLAHLEANLTPATREKIRAFGDEAAKVEELNQGIMAEFGLSPEVMRDRLWMQAIEQHPGLRSRITEALDDRRAANAVVPKKGRLQPGEKDTITGDVRDQVRAELQAQGVEPKMWTPHTPLDAGPASFVNPGNPFLTKGADRMTKRMQKNSGVTMRTGQIDERPSLTISAAAKPSQIKSMTDDVEAFLHENGVPLDVTKDRGMRVDGREFVFVKSTKDGKLNRGAIMKRAHDQAVDLESRGLGDSATVDDLMGLIFDPVKTRQLPNGDVILDKGQYWAMPRAKYDAWLENARTEARRRDLAPGLHKVAQISTGAMINTLPRTNINNLGGVVMSHLGGAGPLKHARYLRDPEFRALTPPELVGRGVSGSQTRAIAAKEGSPALRPARWWTNRMRTNNVLIEDFARGTLAVTDLLKAAKEVQFGGKLKAKMHRVNADTIKIAGNLRETHPELYKKSVQHTIDFVGDMGHISKLDPGFQIASPFWRWSALILKATLNTMPRKYPLRSTLLQAMGEVGREYQREHGIWPSWMQGAIDLGDDIPLLGGVKGEVNATLGTSGWWPYATQSQWIAPGFDNVGIDPLAPLSNVSPLVSMVPAIAGADLERMQRIKDANYRDIEFGSDEWKRMILAKALQMAPTPYSRSGQTNTSLPWDPEYKDNGLPRRGNDWLGLGLRAFGLGTTPVLTGGPDLKALKTKTFKRATTSFNHMTPEEKKAMRKSWREKWGDELVPNHPEIDLGHGH